MYACWTQTTIFKNYSVGSYKYLLELHDERIIEHIALHDECIIIPPANEVQGGI